MSEIIADRATLDLVYMTERAINDGLEIVRLRNQRAALVQALKRIRAQCSDADFENWVWRVADQAITSAEGR